MIKSMTGYGWAEAGNERYQVKAEVRSINNRFLEVVIRMPKNTQPLEERVKKLANQVISRGRLDIFLSVEENLAAEKQLKVDKDLCLAYYNSLLQVAEICGIEPEINLAAMFNFPGILSVEKPEDDLEELWPIMEDALLKAMQNLIKMREAEGEKLAAGFLTHKESISQSLDDIIKNAPLVVSEYSQRLKERVAELLTYVQVDEARLANEVAFFADKVSIDEEIARLESHLIQFSNILQSSDVVGRKLDFLLQEMNREVNTIGSKANSLIISNQVIEMKSVLEKIREQVQNIE